jgi:hypothetical protein
LQTIRYFRQEPISGCAVQNSVVEGQRDIDHRADGNRVACTASGGVDHHGSFLYRAHAQDGALRLFDDRRGEQRAGNAVVGDGERPALDFVRLKFFGAGTAAVNNNKTRFAEAKATGAETLAVDCPFCMVMLTSAAKADGEQVKVLDAAEIVAGRLK